MYQIGLLQKIKITHFLQVRGYKPVPVAWPEMAEEVDELGERLARWVHDCNFWLKNVSVKIDTWSG